MELSPLVLFFLFLSLYSMLLRSPNFPSDSPPNAPTCTVLAALLHCRLYPLFLDLFFLQLPTAGASPLLLCVLELDAVGGGGGGEMCSSADTANTDSSISRSCRVSSFPAFAAISAVSQVFLPAGSDIGIGRFYFPTIKVLPGAPGQVGS